MSPLEDLPKEAGLAASLFVRTGISRAVIARVEGSNPLRYELPIGKRLPLHVGAGKVLAARPPERSGAACHDVTPFVTAGRRNTTAASLKAGDRHHPCCRVRGLRGGRARPRRTRGGSAGPRQHGRNRRHTSRRPEPRRHCQATAITTVTSTVRNAAEAVSRRLSPSCSREESVRFRVAVGPGVVDCRAAESTSFAPSSGASTELGAIGP
jgi:hypothetical protein